MIPPLSAGERQSLAAIVDQSRRLVQRLGSQGDTTQSPRKLVFWGAGRRIHEIVDFWCSQTPGLHSPNYIVDSISPPAVSTIGGIPVKPFDTLLAEDPTQTTVVITAGLLDLQAHVVHRELYYFDILHIRSVETAAYVVSHERELESSLALLSTSQSRSTYLDVLGNVLAGRFFDPSLYEASAYINNSLVGAPQDGLILFAGAFNGKHLTRFRSASPDVRILAFEPSPLWFETIADKFAQDSGIVILNSLLGDAPSVVHYDPDLENHGLAARIERRSSPKTLELRISTLDSAYVSNSDGQAVALIALDVEGAEPDAIRGAQDIIRRFEPVLAICIYHSPSDYLSLPRLVEELFPGVYRFEVLQHSPISAIETVLYCLPRNAE